MYLKKIILLDLCCKAGGAATGYFQAAMDIGVQIEITGIDIEPQPNYPFNFIQADAVDYLKKNYSKYTHFHASPPCQPFSQSTAQARSKGKVYPDILDDLRILLIERDKPAIIENVMASPVRHDIVLRGDMFGLKVLRSRKFELINWFAMKPLMPQKIGSVREGDYCSVFGNGNFRVSKGDKLPKFKLDTVKETWGLAMGIDWMSTKEMSEAIPPAYTRFIGVDFFKKK